jgi:hypothetical protein
MKEELGDRRAGADIRGLLEAGDPLRSEGPLNASDVARMRHTVLAAGQGAPRMPWFWPRVVAATALVVLMVLAGTMANRTTTPRSGAPADATKVRVPEDPAERRQLQFETPGGTRIIWTIDPAFKLEGAAP